MRFRVDMSIHIELNNCKNCFFWSQSDSVDIELISKMNQFLDFFWNLFKVSSCTAFGFHDGRVP